MGGGETDKPKDPVQQDLRPTIQYKNIIATMNAFQPGENFRSYEDRLRQYFKVYAVEEKDKVPVFITIVGSEVYDILMSLTIPDLPSTKSFEELMKILGNHFSPNINKRSERFKFRRVVQDGGESIKEYIIRIQSAAQSCDFGSFLLKEKEEATSSSTTTSSGNYAKYIKLALDDELTDQFITGLRSEKIQQCLINDNVSSFSKCCSLAINMEMTEKETKVLQPSVIGLVKRGKFTVYRDRSQSRSQSRGHSHHRDQSHHRDNPRDNHRKKEVVIVRNTGKPHREFASCRRCGRYHNEDKCPAQFWTCYTCQRKGHTSRVCNRSNVNNINSVDSMGHPAAVVLLNVNQIVLEMEIDSGAVNTVMTKAEYLKYFGNLEINSVPFSLFNVSGQTISILGEIKVVVRSQQQDYNLKIKIIESDRDQRPLVGRDWLDVLYPKWRDTYAEESHVSFIDKSYQKSLFSEIKEKFPNILNKNKSSIVGYKAMIKLKDDIKPIFHCPYSVPYRLKEKVSEELDRLVNQGILIPVKYSSWASPIVVVPKPNGDIRLCMDCKVTINKYVDMEHYPLPRSEDIFASLANMKYFCVIDLSGAYQQLDVSPECQEYLTINTQKGLFRFTRLVFGVSSAPSIFQYVMDQILLNLPKVSCFYDDILVGGKTKEECKQNLFNVLKRLNDHNVKINIDKCKLIEDSVTYLGFKLSGDGLSPTKEHVKAIVDAPVPENKEQLQAYLGLLNFYGCFMPNLSPVIVDLYNLLRKNTKFEWTSQCQLAFENSKQLLLDNQVLEFFDPDKDIILASDASPYGLGCVLSHEIHKKEKPVRFGSCSLTDAEKNYSQLHREALGIVYAVKKFSKYLYGKEFTIYTDHQGLKEIFHPSKKTPAVAAARLQRWAIYLSTFKYKIVHRKGKFMAHADGLSRLPLKNGSGIDSICSLNFSNELPISVDIIRKETNQDKILVEVINYLKSGWPEKVPDYLKPYRVKAESLCTENGCLFYINRIVIPSVLHMKVLKSLHENHIGIVKMKMVARSYVWWRTINNDIVDFCEKCFECQQTRVVPKEKVIGSWSPSKYPFERIHMDFFYFFGRFFLLFVDSFSKFVDIHLMNGTNAKKVKEKLNTIFSFIGLPKEVVTDNGPPFDSHEFKKYLEMHGIEYKKSPPYHPQSNGSGEANVKIPKNVFKKFLLENSLDKLSIQEKIDKFLINHRNLPNIESGQSANDIIFNYKPRVLMDLINNKKEEDKNREFKKKVKINLSNNIYYDKFNKTQEVTEVIKIKKKFEVKEFNKGSKVLYRNHFKDYIRWIPATVIERISKFTYTINVNNHVRFVHLNQIRESKLEDKFHPLIQVLPKVNFERKKIENELKLKSKKVKSNEDKKSEVIETKISKRIRRVPERFCHTKYLK